MVIKAKKQCQHFTIDVKGAYLKARIPVDAKEKLYLRFPDGTVKKLLKYLYGLKQAGFEWQKLVTSDLISAGYDQSQADPLIFSMWRNPETGEKKKAEPANLLFFLCTSTTFTVLLTVIDLRKN